MRDPDILTRIVTIKAEEVIAAQLARPFPDVDAAARAAHPPRGFEREMRQRIATGSPAVIAELKRASPSRGILRDPFDPRAIALSYAQAGATCLSVLTDRPFFSGGARIPRRGARIVRGAGPAQGIHHRRIPGR
jgi:indole-3-glycerol phosphate synthase